VTPRELRRIGNGICITCGSARISPASKSRCIPCLRKLRQYVRNATGFQPWRPGGVGRPPAESKSLSLRKAI
jgi:hypothetical protein